MFVSFIRPPLVLTFHELYIMSILTITRTLSVPHYAWVDYPIKETYAVFIAKAGMKGMVVLWKESFDLLQTLYLKDLWSFLNHLSKHTQCHDNDIINHVTITSTCTHVAAVLYVYVPSKGDVE